MICGGSERGRSRYELKVNRHPNLVFSLASLQSTGSLQASSYIGLYDKNMRIDEGKKKKKN